MPFTPAAAPVTRRALTATYRLQLTRDFTLAAARLRVPYLHELGISHVYLSPILAARSGSTHGYDVIDHARVNPELGGLDELRALAAELHARGMGIVLDIVPNHMAASAENRYWDDVLERGASSRFADWFDIDWGAPHADAKVVLPVLGDPLPRVIDRGELTLHIRDSGARLAYFERTFPLDGATLPKEIQLAQLDPEGRPAAEEWASGAGGRERLTGLLDAQHYRLVDWRRAAEEINYRRFFEVNELVALRMESDEIFDATHALILGLVRDGLLDGLRVDHVDGLLSPSWYLAKLRAAVDVARHADAPEPFPIFVEKILSEDEQLRREWPVQGTTGYDFLNDVEDLFLDPAGYKAIEANYRGLRHNPSLSFHAVAREGKRRVLEGALAADISRVARIAHAWSGNAHTVERIADAGTELIVQMSVYRTYLSVPGVIGDADRAILEDAFGSARAIIGADNEALEMLHRAFFDAPDAGDTLRRELVMRLQQTSGPAAAKGVEDTALYVYVPLAARNEVGGAPDRALDDVVTRVHARNLARSRNWPLALNAVNTHDTKRSADLRARLAGLTEFPQEWARHVSRWRKLNKPLKGIARGKPSPDTNAEYLYYQSLLGIWPAPREHRRVDDLPDPRWLERAADRLSAYMLKAAREAKTRTSWTESDDQFETVLRVFVQATLTPREEAHFLPDVARLTAQVAEAGFSRALARTIIHLTAPGTPDMYQGDEMWNFTLVDPDNRRPVDFDRASALLNRGGDGARLLGESFGGTLGEDRVKLALIARVLAFRREHAMLMTQGEYAGLEAPTGLFGFVRRWNSEVSITLARTRAPRSGRVDETRAVRMRLPHELAGRWMSVLTGREIELGGAAGEIALWPEELCPVNHPCELLFRTRQ